jgi:molybdenum cofactor biosynthesis protein B
VEERKLNPVEHRRDQKVKTGCAILIISDTRNEKSDESGKIAKTLLIKNGHRVQAHKIVKNDQVEILNAVVKLLQDEKIQVIITSGGTGISKRDITVDVLSELFEKTLIGFGEFFRRLSSEQIGEAAMISRATAGIINGKILFCLPGSKAAVKLGLTKLILPGLGHLLWEVNR